MASESGFSTQVKYGDAQHKTIHNLGSQRYGTAVSTKALSEISAVPLSITGVAVDPKDAKTYFLEVAGHGTRKGDVIRFMSGSLVDYELEVVEAVDASIIKILNVGAVLVGDTVKPMRWVTSKSDREGNLNFSPGPTTYIKEGASVVVTEDSTTPANTKALPALATIYKDGVQTPLSDSSTPSEVVAMPVKIMAVDGTNINITTGDINIQSTSEGASFDSIRLGDGSGVYLKIEADGSINAIVDQSVTEGKLDGIQAVLDIINGKDFATETKLEAVRLLIASLDGKDFATETTLAAVSTKLDSLATSAGQSDIVTAIQNIVFDKTGLATSAKQDEAFLKLSEMDLALDNGNTLLTSIDGKATTTNTALGTANTKLTELDNAVDSMSVKLPASLGAKTNALSLSITPATDSGLATEAKQDAGIVELTAIKNSVSAATFIPKTYDEVAMTYNGEGDIGTVIYKLASATIATLTLSYTNGNLTGVVKS